MGNGQATVGRREIAGVLKIDYGTGNKVTKVSAVVTGVGFKEGNAWVAYCRELDLSSCGDTLKQAQQNLGEAIEGFFEACVNRGTLEKALAELGWKCRMPDNHLVACSEVKLPKWIPPAFMIDKIGSGSEWRMQLNLGDPRS